MRTYLDESDTQDTESRSSSNGPDREITLGTSMILLIFFALAVYGAVLFGFGYSLGSKHNDSTTAAATTAPPPASSGFNAFKPAPGSPVGAPSPEKPAATNVTTPTAIVPVAETNSAKPDTSETKVVASVADFVDPSPKTKTPPPAPTVAASPASIPVAPNGTVVVQVAAVSHEEDAELIASTLKRRGYVVNIRTEADKLLHVQVGPFANRKDAEAMKAKLLADGFNAYIK